MPWWWWYYDYYGYGYHRNQRETQRLRNQDNENERNHKYRMQELDSKRKKEEAAAELRKKQKEMEIAKQKEKAKEAQRKFEQQMKQMKLKEKDDAIKDIKAQKKTYENKNAQVDKELVRLKAEFVAEQEKLKVLQNKMKIFREDRERELKAAERLVNLAEEKFKEADRKIRDVIKSTDVDEGNIPQFLNLVNDGLLFATMRGQMESDKMTAKLKVFSELMRRTCAAKLPIDTYFADQGLDRFIPILASAGYENLDDIKCDDKEEYDELKEVVDEGLKEEEKKKDQKMKAREKNLFKKFAMKPQKTWLIDQIAKQDIVRKSLMYSCPKLSNFFGIMHNVIEEVDNLLTYSPELNDDQMKAIQNVPQSSVKIEEVYDDDEKKQDDDKQDDEKQYNKDSGIDDYEERQQLDVNSDCLIKVSDEWVLGKITEIDLGSNGEWLYVSTDDDNNKQQEKVEKKQKEKVEKKQDENMIKVQRLSDDIKPVFERNKWVVGSNCEIYSNSEKKWFQGKVINIKEGSGDSKSEEWLQVEFYLNGTRKSKEIGRYAVQVKVCKFNEEEMKEMQEKDDLLKSKDINNLQLSCVKKEDEKNINNTNKQCNALAKVAVSKLHVIESLADDFTVDEKEIEKLDNEIQKELKPKQAKMKKLKTELEEIGVEMASIEVELEEIEEQKEELEEEDEDEDEDDSDDDDDDSDDSDTNTKGKSTKKQELAELKAEKKELKKKKKKMRLKQNKLQLVVSNLDKDITSIESRRGEIVSREDVLKQAFTVANNIQDSTMQIIKSQSVTRQSILLARELLKYKPANPTDTAKPLWEAITDGVGDIFENALELSKISTEFFSYFMKFKHSFHQFVVANKMNKQVSLLVALEDVRHDIKGIVKFQEKVDEKVDELRKSAIATIRQCVTNTAGAKEFETAVSSKTKAEEEWRKTQDSYNGIKAKSDNEHQKLFAESEQIIASIKLIEFKQAEQDKHKTINNDWIKTLNRQIADLNKLQVT